MTQLPAYNLYAIHRSEISNALLSTECLNLIWYPNRNAGWYVCQIPADGIGVELLTGPYGTERRALSEARAMTDTSGT